MAPDFEMVVTMTIPKINMRGRLVTVYALSALQSVPDEMVRYPCMNELPNIFDTTV
jgi:hypothetical protein